MALVTAAPVMLRSPEYNRLLRLLSRVRFKSKLLIVSEAVTRAAVVLLIALAAAFGLDNLIHLPWLVRLTLGAAIPVGVLFYFVKLARDAFARWHDDRVAVRLEKAYPDLHNQIINAIQLGREPSSEDVARVIQLLVAEAAEQSTRLPLDRAVSWRPVKRWAIALAGAVFAFGLYFILFPNHFRNAATRFLLPTSSVLPVTRIVLDVSPGDQLVARGASVVLKATPRGPLPQKATVCFHQPGQATSLDMVFDGAAFVHSINEIQETMKYQVRAEDFRSQWYTLRVADKPEVIRFQVTSRYPAYTHLAEQVVRSSQGHVRAVVGTRVAVEAWTNQPVAEARAADDREQVIASRLESPARPPDGGRETSRIRLEFPVERDGAYRIVVRNQQKFSNDPAPIYTVKAVPDLRPNILIQSPREAIEVPQGRDVPVLYLASDDFGIISLKAAIARGDGSDRLTLEERNFTTPTLRVEDGFRLSLKRYKIGDDLLLTMTARDGNPLTAGVTVSDPVRIRIVDPNKVAKSELDKFDALDGKLADASKAEARTTEGLTTLADHRLTTGSNLTDKLKKLHDKLEEFTEVQQRVIKATQDLAKTPAEKLTDQQLGELKDVANTEDDWAKYFKEASTDLSRIPETKALDTALVSELVEIYSEIQKVADELQPKNIEMNVPLEQLGAELAEKLCNRMEEWLPDIGDHVKWNMEEPPAPLDVPLAQLPEELEDLMGDLIEQEEDMTADIEDVSSSWADSMSDAGWDTMDGPISNFSAVGKTGNTLPNDTEISGRAGEGRSGKSHGEFVEKSATGKGGRKTPTRLTPDGFEEGIVQDKSTEGTGGSTGGGKRAGFGGRGLTGPTPPVTQDQGIRLAGRQADIREKAQKLEGLLRRYQMPTAKLHDAIGQMREVEQLVRDYRYDSLTTIQKAKMQNLRENETFVREKIKLNQEKTDSIPPRVRHQITQGLQEKFPEGYEDLLKTYYEVLSKSER
jgi:hypothetical protein